MIVKSTLVELRVTTRTREATNINKGLNAVGEEQLAKFICTSSRMTHRPYLRVKISLYLHVNQKLTLNLNCRPADRSSFTLLYLAISTSS